VDEKIASFCRHLHSRALWETTLGPKALFVSKVLAGQDTDRWRRSQWPRRWSDHLVPSRVRDWHSW